MPRKTIMLLLSALVAGLLSTTGAQAAVAVENGVNGSEDGTLIAYTFAHPDGVTPSPVVAMTHGWGGSRTTDFTDGFAKTLLDNGYAVLTWDSRGFGASGGEANVDSQELEVRDLQSLITMIGQRSDVLLDGPEDPRMGMVGGSYAGGIQLMTASADTRIDAIVPQIAWNDLPQSLKPGGVLKLGWDTALYGLGVATGTALGLPDRQTGSVAPQIHVSLAEALALNDWSTATYDWFDQKSPKYYVNGSTVGGRILPGISAPTLILQGLSDTLFNFNQGVANYKAIAARGVPTKLIGFCGGHTITPLGTSCSTTGTDAKLDSATLAWLKRYVKADTAVDTGPAIEVQLQNGTFRSLTSLPTPNLSVSARTVLTNKVVPTTGQGFAGTSGGCRPPNEAEKGAGPGGATPAKEYVAECPVSGGEWVEITQFGDFIDLPTCLVPGETKPPGADPIPSCERINFGLPAGLQILGIGTVDMEITGVGLEGYVFFKLVDYDTVAKTKTVIDDQVTAKKITALGLTTKQYASVDLAGVAWEVKKDHRIFLEVTNTSNDHASSRLANTMNISMTVTLPVTEVATVSGGPSPLAFGNVGITKTATRSVTLTSTGTGALTVSGASLTGSSDFTIAADNCTGGSYLVNEKCTVDVAYTPPAVGSATSSITITTNAGDVTVPISGAGALLPEMSLSVSSIDFGDQTIDVAATPQDIVVTNTGSADLKITTLTISGANAADFSKSTTCVLNTFMAPGASCTVSVGFTPADAGARIGSLKLNTSPSTFARTVPLKGNGIVAAP